MSTPNRAEAARVVQTLAAAGLAWADPSAAGAVADTWAEGLQGLRDGQALEAARSLVQSLSGQTGRRVAPGDVRAEAGRLAAARRPASPPTTAKRCLWCRADFGAAWAAGGAQPAWAGADVCRDCAAAKVPQTAPKACAVCGGPIHDPMWQTGAPPDWPGRAAWPGAPCHRDCLGAWKAGEDREGARRRRDDAARRLAESRRAGENHREAA